jgi:hypothetical protein
MKHKKRYGLYKKSETPHQTNYLRPREYSYFSPRPTSLWSGAGALPQAHQLPEVNYGKYRLSAASRRSRVFHSRNAIANNFRRVSPQLYMPERSMPSSLPHLPNNPPRPLHCLRRVARRAVLFALQVAGQGAGSQKRPTWTKTSYLSCR